MKNKGVTLIEMMIVLAIMGIMFANSALTDIGKRYTQLEEKIIENETLLQFRCRMNRVVNNASNLIIVLNNKVDFDNGSKIRIDSRNNSVFVDGRNFRFKNFNVKGFEKVNDKTLLCKVRNSKNTFYLYWSLKGDRES